MVSGDEGRTTKGGVTMQSLPVHSMLRSAAVIHRPQTAVALKSLLSSPATHTHTIHMIGTCYTVSII